MTDVGDSDSASSQSPVATVAAGVPESAVFDSDGHAKRAMADYEKALAVYEDFALAIESILKTCLSNEGVSVHSIEHRAKSVTSFGRKAARAADDDPNSPRYPFPLTQITDLAGARIITYFLSTVDRIEPILHGQFEVREKVNKSQLLEEEEKLGYHSVHYVVSLKWQRHSLPEYARFRGLVAEVQIRTILQHAWAEIEHDIQYKAVTALPATIRRRFMSLAGMLEIADREFQAIEEEDSRLREQARQSVAEGRLADVEITGDALKAYLDNKYGPDGRMSDWSYGYDARLLRSLGFTDLNQVDSAISPFDDDQVSRTLWGSRLGQLSRFEDVLLAALGEGYALNHPWAQSPGFRERTLARLQKLQAAGIAVGTYRMTSPEGGAVRM